jgi:two-component system chemotaxis response regulator CheB
MPRMDGITYLKEIMQSDNPFAVIICSSYTTKGSDKTIESLENGAFEAVFKPKMGAKESIEKEKEYFINLVKEASKAKIQKLKMKKEKSYNFLKPGNDNKIIALGLSTGGIQVLEQVLPKISDSRYPIVIVQHLPSGFTATLARRLNKISQLEVIEVTTKTALQNSFAYIANSREHLIVNKDDDNYFLETYHDKKVNGHIPSIDVLFESIATAYKENALGILCTGMGDDGARGLLKMRDTGAKTYAQNEKSSIVYGMPRVAMEIGAAQKSISLEEMVDIINNFR